MNKRSIKEYVQNKKGITLVSLVVTIVVLIILAGVSISAIFGENGIITIAKQAKENIEQAQIQEQTELNELYTQIQTDIGNSGETSYDVIAEFVEFKKIIAEAITKKGVETKPTDSATTMANNIASIKTEKPTEGTAVAGDILLGKTAWVNGNKLTGNMPNNGAQTANLNAGGSYTIPKGYHNGSGRITANSLASQTGATAVAGDILSGKTAWINGNKVTGNMANNGAYMARLTGNDLVYWADMNQDLLSNIPDGYHKGSKVYIPAAELQKFKNTYYDKGYNNGYNTNKGNPALTTGDWSSFTADIGSRYLITIFGYINSQSHRFALNGCEVLFDSGPKYTQKYSGIWGFGQSYIVRATENNIRIPTGTACGISYVKI